MTDQPTVVLPAHYWAYRRRDNGRIANARQFQQVVQVDEPGRTLVVPVDRFWDEYIHKDIYEPEGEVP